MLSPATIAALRADYTDVSPTLESPDPRLVALLDSYEHLRALRDAVTALLPDLWSHEGDCNVCGTDGPCTEDCTAAPLRVAYRAVSPRKVSGRPAGQRIAEEPTAEARELLGLDVAPDRAALLSLYHDDATDLLDSILAKAGVDSQERGEEFHEEHAALVEALADAHTNGRPLDVATTVPDETIQAGGRFFVFDGESYDDGYRTLDEARAAAERTLAECREIAEDSFWPEEARGIAYGEVRGKASASSVEDPDRDISGDPDEIIDIQLIEVPRG